MWLCACVWRKGVVRNFWWKYTLIAKSILVFVTLMHTNGQAMDSIDWSTFRMHRSDRRRKMIILVNFQRAKLKVFLAFCFVTLQICFVVISRSGKHILNKTTLLEYNKQNVDGMLGSVPKIQLIYKSYYEENWRNWIR